MTVNHTVLMSRNVNTLRCIITSAIALALAVSLQSATTAQRSPVPYALGPNGEAPGDFLFPYLWHLHNEGTRPESVSGEDINVIPAWEGEGDRPGVSGAGVNIAFIDTGVQLDHPDLMPHIDLNEPYNAANPARLDLDLLDNDNNAWPGEIPGSGGMHDEHGTFATGIAAAVGFNVIGMRGVAHDAGIVPIRMIQWGVTLGTDQQRHLAFTHRLYENTPESPGPGLIDVSNNSWFPDSSNTLAPLGPLARQGLIEGTTAGRNGRGVVYVFAVGHGRSMVYDDTDHVDYFHGDVNYNGFASSRYTIAAGSCDGAGFHTFYSEPGAALMVVAPSTYLANVEPGDFVDYQTDLVQLYSTTINPSLYPPTEYAEDDPERLYYSNYGGGNTSATAQISGVVALMLEMNPNLTWRDVQHIIVRSSEPTGPPLPAGPSVPFDRSEWQRNGAGLWFNHDYGFGRVDAEAAVTMAHSWINFAAATPIVVNHSEETLIPDNNETGIAQTVTVDNPEEMLTEHVEVTLTGIDHANQGDLEIVLVSPSGTQSMLTAARPDHGESYENHLFTTVVNWGEDPQGTWTLRVRDLSSVNSSVPGSLFSWTMTIYGYIDPNRTDLSGISMD